MKKLAILVSLVLMLGVVSAQQGGLNKSNRKPPANMTGPVTQAEVSAVFAKVDKILMSVPGVKVSAKKRVSSAAPASTAQVVLEMSRTFDLARPAFKFTPAKMTYDRNDFAIKDPAARSALEKLVAWGCVSRVGPVATNEKNLSIAEFGDALGYFLARISELTHLPSSKFSPGLMPPDG